MKEKKPCDDIFDGLAELLINNGEVTSNHYTRSQQFGHEVFNLHTAESWSVNYGGYVYMIDSEEGAFVSIRRVNVRFGNKESGDD